MQLSTTTLRLLVVAGAVLAMSADIFEELTDTQNTFQVHHLFEFAAILGLSWVLWLEVQAGAELRKALQHEKQQVSRLSGELASYVDRCFQSWQLTPAEQEIAWLLLKGFSFAEIAGLREVKEKTLRQQASSIYGKAKVSGRSELSATFIEDLLTISAGQSPGVPT